MKAAPKKSDYGYLGNMPPDYESERAYENAYAEWDLQNKICDATNEEIQDSIESSLKEAKHWLGSWSALRELINDLEDREKEKAYENPKY